MEIHVHFEMRVWWIQDTSLYELGNSKFALHLSTLCLQKGNISSPWKILSADSHLQIVVITAQVNQ